MTKLEKCLKVEKETILFNSKMLSATSDKEKERLVGRYNKRIRQIAKEPTDD